ncbi:unnamed protein product [Angiostrongylus costaricensis]|uniref:Neur_chan_memb domain-containing protein n=1 Tax=Angiostrongylus costaricensis TaxID=334426 RepID=A0A158PHW4_ANGCS|nr:unnamed protein product [Angiostrongylus costaricensis]
MASLEHSSAVKHRQIFAMDFSHDGYTTADIDYFWGRHRTDTRQGAVAFDKFMLPQFKQTGYNVNITKAVTSSGEYVRLYFEVLLVRNMGFYSMNIVIPSMLIVTISWVSFWLNREASPARVGLGVTTVLTMTTLITTTNVSDFTKKKKRLKETNILGGKTEQKESKGRRLLFLQNSMPKVSYIKGLDVFLNFCFVMVFASLVEYAVVSYMNKRIALRREKRRRQAEQQQRTEMPMFSNAPFPKPTSNAYEMAVISQNSTPSKSYAPHASKTCRNVTPAKIDKCSRYLFPLLFSGFNGSYSRLLLLFIFDRESGFYMLQIFVPAALVVVISWVSFWISRDSAPSRTIIGVMTVLTETHLMTGTNRRLPPVAYVKAVDVYLGFCYLLVVFALIEYACVAYSKKKNEDRRRREKKTEQKLMPTTPDLLHDVRLAECTCNAEHASIITVIKQPNRFCVRHSQIDIVSRVVFPTAVCSVTH